MTSTHEDDDADRPALTVVIPAFNETGRLSDTLPAVMGLAGPAVEVVFVDDGSTDGTGELLHGVARDHAEVSLVTLPANRGKGAAVRAGVERARGRAVMFLDADLATDLSSLAPLLAALERADVAIGSRAVVGTVIQKSSRRRSRMGDVFNRLVRATTGVPFRDTQCGFKAFNAEAAKLLFHFSQLDGFAFDVEVLAVALAMGLQVEEVPVRWREVGGSHVRGVRDPARMAWDVAVTRRRNPRRIVTLRVPHGLGPQRWSASRVAAVVGAGRLVVDGPEATSALLPFTPVSDALVLARRIRERTGAAPDVVLLTAGETAALMRSAQRVPARGATRWIPRAADPGPAVPTPPAPHRPVAGLLDDALGS